MTEADALEAWVGSPGFVGQCAAVVLTVVVVLGCVSWIRAAVARAGIGRF